ncbi:MAG: hypothetical protein ACJA0Q_001278 [Saprospiraceae bacterium]|jgi:hypothetical protein
MPFTFAHPAVLIPFKYLPSKWYSVTGLIIGALVPDFEYFFRMKLSSTCSHTIQGLFLFNLPVAIVLSIVFHLIVKKPLFDNSPHIIQKRLESFVQLNWTTHFKNHYIAIIMSILIGAFSHIAWDSFTHEHGLMCRKILFLQNDFQMFKFHAPRFKVLQHSSTMLGFLAITYQFLKLPTSSVRKANPDKYFWLIVFVIITLVVAMKFLTGLSIKQYGNVVVTFISASMIGVLVSALLLFTLQQVTKDNKPYG